MLIVGYSLLSNLSRYPEIWKIFSEIWRKYFKFWFAGDKAQNVLWRVNNFHFSSN